jgi:hypothetical protein
MEAQFGRDLPGTPLWFFDDSSGAIQGYLGTDPVVFVGQRPSTGGGGPARQTLSGFYRLLSEYGFADAHVTDIVKEQMRVGMPSNEQVERNWPFFREELEILQPKVLVALGGWVFQTLDQRLDALIPVRRFTHYSYRFGQKSKLEQELRASFARLRDMLASSNSGCCIDGAA